MKFASIVSFRGESQIDIPHTRTDFRVAASLEHFRSSQSVRTKLPESLWQAAVELARQYGIYPVAHPLRLGYMGLNKRLGEVPSPHRRKAVPPAFVELVAAQPAALEACIIEFESAGRSISVLVWRLRPLGRDVDGSAGDAPRNRTPEATDGVQQWTRGGTCVRFGFSVE